MAETIYEFEANTESPRHPSNFPLATRMLRLGTETAFEVLAAQGRSIVHVDIGEPDFNTPAHIFDAAIQSLRDGWHHYTPSAGIPELRAPIAEAVSRSHGIEVSPDEEVVTPGAKPVILFSLLSFIEEGDEVI